MSPEEYNKAVEALKEEERLLDAEIARKKAVLVQRRLQLLVNKPK